MKLRAAKRIPCTLLHTIDANASAGKQLNMGYLACSLPIDTGKDPENHRSEYWDRLSPEARPAQEICAFECLIGFNKDGITSVGFCQLNISFIGLRS
jgi:hypothetical protein